MKLLGIDIETGGISRIDDNEKPSVLSLYLAIVDEKFKIQEDLNLLLRPNPDANGRINYCVQAEGLAVNKINLIEHDSNAYTYKEAKPLIYSWLQNVHNKYQTSLVPFGNMVGGDINAITSCLLNSASWENFVDRRVIELSSLGQTLKIIGKIPKTQSLSLSKIAEYFNIYVDESLLHTAKYDVLLGAHVLREYTKLMN